MGVKAMENNFWSDSGSSGEKLRLGVDDVAVSQLQQQRCHFRPYQLQTSFVDIHTSTCMYV